MAGNLWTRLRAIGAGLAAVAAGLLATGRPAIVSSVDNAVQPEEKGPARPATGGTVAGDILPPGGTAGLPAEAEPRGIRPKTIDDIFAEIATKVPGFGGAFLSPDPSESAVFVYLTDPSQEKLDQFVGVVQRDYGSEVGPLTEVSEIRAVQGKYDYVELKNWYDLAVGKTVGVKGLRTTDIQEANNRLEFGVKTEEAHNEVRAILKELGVPDGASLVRVVADPVQPLDSLQAYHRPLIGGLQVAGPVGPCTLGFQAVIGGNEGFFTAGHCTQHRGIVDGDTFGQPDTYIQDWVAFESLDPPFWSTWQGCSSSVPCRYSDSAFIRKGSGVSIMDGFIARAADGSPTWDPGLYNLRIDTTGPLYLNDHVFKVGRTTGLTHGQVYATCVDLIDDSRVGVDFDVKYLCQSQVVLNIQAIGGDSGSGVFKCPSAAYPTWNCTSGSSIDLVGILSYTLGGAAYFGNFPYMSYEYGSIDVVEGSPGGGGGR